MDEPAVRIEATVETVAPGTVDIRQDEAPAGSWIGRLRANRAAVGPPIPPRTFAFSQRVRAARLPFFAAVYASLMEEELRSLMEGDVFEADPHVALRRHIEAAGDEAA
ncbi:hypothetical protein [Methylorubrum thiocyanatum]|uniref:hypothetical protein n=1 Tax=Methylorubrum thiocyanatum TaxID=47958 RepID=UPI0035C7C8AB